MFFNDINLLSFEKAFKVGLNETFRDVLHTFLEKSNQVVLDRFFTLCLDMAGSDGEIMNLDDSVGSFPLPTPVCYFNLFLFFLLIYTNLFFIGKIKMCS